LETKTSRSNANPPAPLAFEVSFGVGLTEVRNDTLVDAVRIHDDSAFGGLAEHLGQAHHRDGAARDHVGQHLAGADRWQLIDIADDEQGCLVRDRLEERMHQQHVHHRGFVDNQQIAVEWVRFVAPESDPYVSRRKSVFSQSEH
jgi:hypothetical protein